MHSNDLMDGRHTLRSVTVCLCVCVCVCVCVQVRDIKEECQLGENCFSADFNHSRETSSMKRSHELKQRERLL